jgi:transcription antitermination factor NusG
LKFGSTLAVISEPDMQQVRLMAGTQLAAPCAYLAIGRRVRVVIGPLAGVYGILNKVKDAYQLVVGLELLGRACSVTLDSWMVEPA